tara:strand:+ start:2368 stop:2592 length:225 start_codon:yes stop_codon:yes gene_type:complete
MSVESKIMEKASIVVGFIKENIRSDLKTASDKKMIEVENNELEKICNLIESSVMNSFVKGSQEFLSLAEHLKSK